MKTNKLVALILSAVATFFSFLAIFMLIPEKVYSTAWSYVGIVLIFLSAAGLLTFTILDFVGVNFKKELYAISLSGFALFYLLTAIQQIVDMAQGYGYEYGYLTDLVEYLCCIFFLVVLCYGIKKKNVVATVFSLTFLGAHQFFDGLRAFNGMLFSLFKENLYFLPQFESFLFFNGTFLFFLAVAFIAYRAHKDEL